MTNEFRDTMARMRAKTVSPDNLPDNSLGGQLGGIPRSIVEQTTSLFGIPKSPEQIIYEKQYPVTNFVAGMFGIGGAYGAAFKGVRSIKKLDNLIEGLEIANSPIKTAMLKDAARTGVIEAGRVGIGQIVGQDPLIDDLAESALNVGFGAVASGGVNFLMQGGKKAAPLQELFKDINLDDPPQLQLRALSQKIAEPGVDPSWVIEARNRMARLTDQVRTASPEKYVRKTIHAKNANTLDRLFKAKDHPKNDKVSLFRRRFMRAQTSGFKTDQEWQDKLTQAALPPDWASWAQYPRHISFRGDKASNSALTIQNTMKRELRQAGDDWWITQEEHDGLFVLARKIAGDPKTFSEADEWLLFKTDTPGKFLPSQSAWHSKVADHAAFLAAEVPSKGPIAPIYDGVKNFAEKLQLRQYIDLDPAKGSPAEFGKRVSSWLGLDGVMKGTGEMTKRARDFVVEYAVPTVHQFGRSPRAGRIMAIAQSAFDDAENMMRQVVYGEKALDAAKPSLRHVFAPGELQGSGIKKMLDDLEDSDVEEFWNIWRSATPLEEIDELFAKGKVSERTRELVKKLDEIDNDLTGQISAIEEATGGGNFKKMKGHFGVSRNWEGDNRIALRGEDQKLIGIAAGDSRVTAQKNAHALQQQLATQGKISHLAEEFDITDTAKLPSDLKLSVSRPGFILERGDIAGYKFYSKPWTKKELLETYAANVRKRTKYMAHRTVRDLMADDLAKVQVEDPAAYRMLVGRLNDLEGVRSPGTKMQEQIVDRLMGPVMGANSASKIVGATNSMMWHFELGGLRLAYPVVNALTFMQTVLPEAAFVLSAKPEILAKYYTQFAMKGTKSAGSMGVLDPLKMWKQATSMMARPDAGFNKVLQRGMNEGIVDPKFVEEWVGQSTAKVKDWKAALSSPGGFVEWMKSLSEFVPALSEKWSRANALSLGYLMGKDVLGLVDDDLLYKFAKDFTDRTMFRYGMEARPRVFTTPAGSFLGLFKNWMLHYMGMMADYAGEGVVRNNWAPLMWQTAGTFAVGGAAAVPLFGAANALSGALTDKSLMLNTYEAFGDNSKLADGVFYGLPALLTGVSMSSQVEAPLSNPARDATMLFDFVQMQRANAAANFMGGAWDQWQATGQNPMGDANTRDQMARAFAPKTLYRAFAAMEDQSVRSMNTSYPILKEVGLASRMWYTLGFNPVEIEKAYEVSDELWKDQNKMRKSVARYGEALANAWDSNDTRLMQVVMQRAAMEGVDLSSVQRSAQTRLNKAEADVLSRSFKQEDIDARMAALPAGYGE